MISLLHACYLAINGSEKNLLLDGFVVLVLETLTFALGLYIGANL